MTQSYKPLANCLCCNSNDLIKILDLNDQPLANSYLNSKNDLENFYPLGLSYCNNCTHLQLTHAVNPDLLFKHYLYVSGTTETGKRYFNSFVDFTTKYFSNNEQKFSVLDIASNDGSQLDSFKDRGHHTYGIDPAENLYERCARNHVTICDYLTDPAMQKFGRKFDIIIAQNVFAHNSYPEEFLRIAGKYLEDNGRIFIQTSQANMISNGQFDTVYHEHMSFFNIRSMSILVKKAGLFLLDVQKTAIHGTSYVFVISNNPSDDNTEKLLLTETTQTLTEVEKFAHGTYELVNQLKSEIEKYKNNGYSIIGYGAAAKGNTVLNFGKIDLDAIVDDNPLKWNLFTPGRKIKIISFDQFDLEFTNRKIVWIPLAWNFFEEIKQKIQKRRNNKDVFLRYFPKVVSGTD